MEKHRHEPARLREKLTPSGHWVVMASFLERFYPLVPVPLQNLGISLYGLAWKRERLGGKFYEYVAGFRERDRWSRARMNDYLTQQLQSLLLRAYYQVPAYQRLWSGCGLTTHDLERITLEQLPEIPITTKQELRSNGLSFVARDATAIGGLKKYFSSGSTGTPVTTYCTAEDHRRFVAAREVRSFGWAGTSLRSPRAMIGGRLVVPKGISRPPFHRYNSAESQLYFSAYHIAPEHVRHYVDAFNRYQPVMLTGYAYSYFLLARMMCEQGLSLDYEPAAAVLSSEKLTPAMKRIIKRAFRTRVFEEYGMVENCALATECECGALHVSSDFGVVELVDEDGRLVPPGIEGRVVCTGLLNNSQILVRYETGDLAAWSTEPCPCGREHLPVLKEVIGRIEDVIVGPDGRQMVRFHWVFIDLPGVIEGQIVQEAIDRFTVKVVSAGELDPEVPGLIEARFRERLGPVSVQIEQVDRIQRTERGKFKAVISKVAQQELRKAA